MGKVANKGGYRYERKFVISGLYNKELESMIRFHPALFREIYEMRRVNNIYFDTYNLKNYRDNIDGRSDRIKVRIRWYGDLFGEILKPVLEYKIKSSLVGKKESFPLKSFVVDQEFTKQKVSEMIAASDIPDYVREHFKRLQPTLLNCYKRRYFLSANKRYRITLDQQMEYYKIRSCNNYYLQRFKDLHSTIIELKYTSDHDDTAPDIANLFPFRMTKSSKYVNGIDRFFGSTI